MRRRLKLDGHLKSEDFLVVVVAAAAAVAARSYMLLMLLVLCNNLFLCFLMKHIHAIANFCSDC